MMKVLPNSVDTIAIMFVNESIGFSLAYYLIMWYSNISDSISFIKNVACHSQFIIIHFVFY